MLFFFFLPHLLFLFSLFVLIPSTMDLRPSEQTKPGSSLRDSCTQMRAILKNLEGFLYHVIYKSNIPVGS